ncbi:OmpA family protein [Ilumatobacter sp.]|uniref:OmpA family protein n=1 Tax=Ilumatobacter sp. TaxID=1967498 RepID=UPI003B5159D3
MSGSGGKRNHHEEEHEEHVNHEAWVIPYADVLTLLMALFLVLWALGDPSEDKTEVVADSFRRELGTGIGPFQIGSASGAGPLSDGGTQVIGELAPAPTQELGAMPGEREGGDPDEWQEAEWQQAWDEALDAADWTDGGTVEVGEGGRALELDLALPNGDLTPIRLDPATFRPVEDGDEVDVELGDPLDVVEQTVRDEAIGSGLNTSVGFRREARGLVVTIVSDQVLFREAAADVQADGIVILDVIAESLRDLPNSIIIEGHTDSRPIATDRYPSNWELSTARATSVLRYLVEQRGIDGDRVAAAGYADTRPVATGSDDTSLARNRRVEIVVLQTA